MTTKTYTTVNREGVAQRIVARVADPITTRYGVKVNGVEVGRGFPDADAAIVRGIEYVRNVDAGRGEWA